VELPKIIIIIQGIIKPVTAAFNLSLANRASIPRGDRAKIIK
jgi:hypothetical protein